MTADTLRQLSLKESRRPKPECQGNSRTHPKLTRKKEKKRKHCGKGAKARGIVGVMSTVRRPEGGSLGARAPPAGVVRMRSGRRKRGGCRDNGVRPAARDRVRGPSPPARPGRSMPRKVLRCVLQLEIRSVSARAATPPACPLWAAGEPLLFLPEGVRLDQG